LSPCRLCGADALEEVLNFGNQPVAHHYPNHPGADEYAHAFVIDRCLGCGFLQIADPIPPDRLYSDNASYITSHQIQHQMDDELATLFGLCDPQHVLEIACNDGDFLLRLRERGVVNIVGIEPNEPVARIAERRGARVVREMFTQTSARKLKEGLGPFDVIVARMVIEHIENLHDFMMGMRHTAADHGIVLIEVPDLWPALISGDASYFWEEHVNYFTEFLICQLLERYRFEVVARRIYNRGGGALAIFARKLPETPEASWQWEPDLTIQDLLPKLREKVTRQGELLRAALQRARGAGMATVVYGAGFRACTLINVHQLRELIDFIVDDRPDLQSLYMPGSHLGIHGSAKLAEITRPILCLLAVSNENEAKVKAKAKSATNAPLKFSTMLAPRDFAAELQTIA
jgi:SAM-dependent methyltransferase